MECAICLENTLKPFETLRCQHTFHKECINIWLSNHITCPMCREIVTFIHGTIDKKPYKIAINNTHLYINHETHTSILNFSNIKNIEYKKKDRLVTLIKRESFDPDFIKIKIKSDKAFIIFDNLRMKMQRLVTTGY